MKIGRIQWALILIVAAVIVVMAPSDEEIEQTMPNRASGSKHLDTMTLSSMESGQKMKGGGKVELERLDKSEMIQSERINIGNVFNSTSWKAKPPQKRIQRPVQSPIPVPPPQPVVVAPPAPVAPPLPFTYLGQYKDADSRIIILSKGDRVYTVAVGETIEGTYRIFKYSDGAIYFTYLPLNIEQSLRTGEIL